MRFENSGLFQKKQRLILFTNECLNICEWYTKIAKQSKRDKKTVITRILQDLTRKEKYKFRQSNYELRLLASNYHFMQKIQSNLGYQSNSVLNMWVSHNQFSFSCIWIADAPILRWARYKTWLCFYSLIDFANNNLRLF